MKKIFLTISFVLILAILSVSILLNKGNLDSLYLWANVAWVVFLILLNVFVSGFFYSGSGSQKENSSPNMGILPSLNIWVFLYSFLSLGLLLLNIFSTKINISIFSTYHLVLQICLASFFVVISLLVRLAAEGAKKN